MKSKTIFIILIIFTISELIILSCEKDITVDLPKTEEKLNVQASIDLNEYPIVFLTKNMSYFDKADTAFVKNLIVSGNQAVVVVSCNGIADTLSPHKFPVWPFDGYIGSKFKGAIGNYYDLKINYDNKEYYATTTIRDTIGIDSVKFNIVSIRDTFQTGYLTLFWRNPSTNGNYFAIRLKSTYQNWFFRPMMVNVIDDKLIDNSPFVSCPFVTKSYARNSFFSRQDEEDTLHFEQEFLFKIGDTISIQLSTLDEISYLFWSSWERNKMTDGNPFMNPASVKSNIKGAPANGAWIGYGAFIKSFFINNELKVVPIDY
ncbi:MAG: DUF4249 domain-containing protein [Bacteroidales bacterium]|jgi:hypothetical protein|nr:DUF4249 domain-containing protein [Bacteroidales bacterium]